MISLKQLLSSLILALGFASAGWFISHGLIEFKAFDRYVSVKGLAEKEVKSDTAVWDLQISYASNTLEELYAGIKRSQDTVKAFLLQQGFAADDIQIRPVSVEDAQANQYNSNQQAKRYKATTGLNLRTFKVDAVARALQETNKLIESGIVLNQSNVQYLFTQLNEVKPAMLDEATKNAKAAAQTFAKNANAKIGSIRSASQGQFTISDLNTDYVGMGSSITKKVRIVTTVDYFLQ